MEDVLKNLELKKGLTKDDCIKKVNNAIEEDFIEDDIECDGITYIAIGNKAAEKLFNELFEGATFKDYREYFEQDESWGDKACDITMMIDYIPGLSEDVYYSAENKELYVKTKKNREQLYEVLVGEDKIKVICRRVNGIFQDIKTNCVYGSSVINFKEI